MFILILSEIRFRFSSIAVWFLCSIVPLVRDAQMDGEPAKYLNRSALFHLENLDFWRKTVAVSIIDH